MDGHLIVLGSSGSLAMPDSFADCLNKVSKLLCLLVGRLLKVPVEGAVL